jgi:hypothetical protein
VSMSLGATELAMSISAVRSIVEMTWCTHSSIAFAWGFLTLVGVQMMAWRWWSRTRQDDCMTMATTIGWRVGCAQPRGGAATAITIMVNKWWWLLVVVQLIVGIMLVVGVCWCCCVLCVSLACSGCLFLVFEIHSKGQNTSKYFYAWSHSTYGQVSSMNGWWDISFKLI